MIAWLTRWFRRPPPAEPYTGMAYSGESLALADAISTRIRVRIKDEALEIARREGRQVVEVEDAVRVARGLGLGDDVIGEYIDEAKDTDRSEGETVTHTLEFIISDRIFGWLVEAESDTDLPMGDVIQKAMILYREAIRARKRGLRIALVNPQTKETTVVEGF